MAKPNFKKLVKQYTATNPMDEFSFGSQATDLWQNYRDSLGLLKLQGGQLRGQFRNERAAAKQQGRLDMGAAIGGSLERGVLGSSSDVSDRAAVRAGVQTNIVSARSALTQGLQANLAQRMAARNDYRAGMVGLAQQRMAAKSLAASQSAFEQGLNTILGELQGGAGGGGGNGGGNGDGGSNERLLNRRSHLSEVLRNQLAHYKEVAGTTPTNPAGMDLRIQQMNRIENRLRGVWGRRNNVLEKLGRDPRKMRLLLQRLANITGEDLYGPDTGLG